MSKKTGPPAGAGGLLSLYRGGRGVVNCFLEGGEDDGDAGAHLGTGDYLEPAAVALHDPLGNGQAQAGAACLPVRDWSVR